MVFSFLGLLGGLVDCGCRRFGRRLLDRLSFLGGVLLRRLAGRLWRSIFGTVGRRPLTGLEFLGHVTVGWLVAGLQKNAAFSWHRNSRVLGWSGPGLGGEAAKCQSRGARNMKNVKSS